MNDLIVRVNNGEIQLAKETSRKIKTLIAKQLELNKLVDELKEEMLFVMTDLDMKEWQNDIIKVTRKDAYTRKSVDTQKLKADGLYEKYLKESDVKPSVSVTFK